MRLIKALQPAQLLDARWKRTLLIVFIAQTIVAVGYSSIFPFLPLYVESLGTSTNLSVEFLAGLVYSAQAFTMMIASPIWGAVADRVGRKLMVERAMFGGALMTFLMAFVQTAEQLIALRAIQGLITGVVAASNALVASETPRERTGFAMGMLQVALGAGIALGPLIGGSIADFLGYSAAFYVTAALLFLSGVMVHFGVHEAFVPSEALSGNWKSFLREWRQIMASAGVMKTYAISFMYMLGRMMIVPVTPLFIATLLPDSSRVNTFNGLVIGTAAATATISAAFLGRLGDRVGHRRIVAISAGVAALLYAVQSLVTEGWQLLVLQALVGVCLGGILPALSALLARYTKSGEEGAVYGLNNSIRSAGSALAPLVGASVAYLFSLRATFLATGLIFLVMGIIAARFLPQPKGDEYHKISREYGDSKVVSSQ